MSYSQNPYEGGRDAGQKHMNGDVVTILESLLTHPTHADGFVDKGDPCYAGDIVGVALKSAAAATEYIPVDPGGIWDLNVVASDDDGTSAVAFGDQLYIGTDGVISKKASGTKFGFAVAAASASASATVIPVLVGPMAGEGLRGLLDIEEALTAAAPALNTFGVSTLDSTDNAVNGTLADGDVVGQMKLITMTEASNSSTVTIAKHETSSPEVATFDAVGEILLLIWGGAKWYTVKATATFV